MISGYRNNKKKYENSINYINNHSDISDTLKKDIVTVMERYRISIFCMEEEEVYALIEICARDGSSIPLKRELHTITGGSRSCTDNYYYCETSGRNDDDDEYDII